MRSTVGYSHEGFELRRWAPRLWRRCRRHPGALAVVLAASAGGALLTAAVPVVQRAVVDDVIVARRTSAVPLIAVLLAAAVCAAVAAYARRAVAGRLALGVERDLRDEMAAALFRSDGPAQDRLTTGELIGRATSDTGAVRSLLEELPALAGSGLLLLLSLGLMLWMSPLLTLVAAVVVPLMWVVSRWTYRLVPPAAALAQQRAAEVTEVVAGAVSGVRVVKAFAQEDRELARLTDAAVRLYAARMRLVGIRGWLGPLIGSVSALGQVAVLGVGGWLAVRGSVSLGTFLAFTTYLGLLMGPARVLAGLVPTVQQTAASAVRVLELIGPAGGAGAPSGSDPLPPGPLAVSFEELRFGYEPGHPVLDGFSAQAGAGGTLVVTGGSGSGKSTLATLLTGFYEPQGGTVRVGGVPVRDVPLDHLRSAVGVVWQESFLARGTIAENIAYGRPGASREDVAAAARTACAHDFVAALPEGYDTEVGEGGLTLSGGQRQRVALARALLAGHRVLVLDDATSAVDAGTERRIQANLASARAGFTTVILTNRPHTVPGVTDLVELGGKAIATAAPGESTELVQAVPDTPAVRTGVDMSAAGRPWRSLPDLLGPLRGGLLWSVLLVVLSSAGVLALPLVVRAGIDRGITAADAPTVGWAALAGLGVVTAAFLLSAAQSRVVGRAGERLLLILRVKAFAQLQRLSVAEYERRGTGSILTRMSVDIDTLARFLQSELAAALSSVLWLIGIGAVLVAIDVPLGLALLLVQPLVLAATLWYRSRSAPAYDLARTRLTAITAELHETAAGLRTLQGLNAGPRRLRRFAELGHAYASAQLRAQRLLGGYLAAVQLIADLSMVAVLLIGAYRVTHGSMTVGALAAFLLYIGMFLTPVQDLSEVFDTYQQAAVGMRRVGELLRAPVASTAAAGLVPLPVRLRGELAFSDVVFRYPGRAEPALDGVHLRVPAGRTVALVGETGAGKSTLVKLLCGTYPPLSGSIRTDGTDITHFDPVEYRRRLGVVPQEPYLFAGTVADNIAYGQPDAGPDQVRAAALAVGAHDAIAALGGGYDHRVGAGGRNLSAGQRQLISLARAYLIDPDILVMDEPTAALDPVTEAAVAAATAALTDRRTTVVVAHRLSVAAAADLVAVMHDGRITECGPHDELLTVDGRYRRLWLAYTDQVPVAAP